MWPYETNYEISINVRRKTIQGCIAGNAEHRDLLFRIGRELVDAKDNEPNAGGDSNND